MIHPGRQCDHGLEMKAGNQQVNGEVAHLSQPKACHQMDGFFAMTRAESPVFLLESQEHASLGPVEGVDAKRKFKYERNILLCCAFDASGGHCSPSLLGRKLVSKKQEASRTGLNVGPPPFASISKVYHEGRRRRC